MRTIWKYPLQITDAQTVTMPVCSTLLSVQMQHGRLCLWAEVDTDEETVDREINISGTGHDLERRTVRAGGTFIGTVQDGDLVWHVFDGGLKPCKPKP